MKDRISEQRVKVVPDKDLRAFMNKVGIPAEMFEVYRETVDWETDMKAFAADYATAIDYFSPDRHEEVEKQNARIREIRRAMATTEIGRRKIADMKEKKIGDNTTIPYPVFID